MTDGSLGATMEMDPAGLMEENQSLREQVEKLTAKLAGLQVSYDTLVQRHEASQEPTEDQEEAEDEITPEALRKRLSRLCAPRQNGQLNYILL